MPKAFPKELRADVARGRKQADRESFDEAMDVFFTLEQRQSERNSIALMLDAYEEHRAGKARSRAA